MKNLLNILLIIITIGCTKEEIDSVPSLEGSWRQYSIKILKMDQPLMLNSCDYKTQLSDLYGVSNISSCKSDDIYEFMKNNKLIIKTGDKKCTLSEPAIITKSYTQKGDSLILDGIPHYIVLLTRDTLILDYCDALTTQPPGTVTYKAKIGMKFVSENRQI